MRKKQTFEDALNLTPMEKEVITLKASLDLINEMVNNETMGFHFRDPNSSIFFKSMTHKAFFNVLLVDFLSVPSDFFNGGLNYVERLKNICDEALLGKGIANVSINPLSDAVCNFSNWLEEVVTIEKRWFPSIDLEIDLTIKRQDFVTMCGNISKHNFTQQTRQAKKFKKLLEDNNKLFSLEECLIALEDFQIQFNDDVLSAHSSTIAEFLNNIRWGIYTYCSFERSRAVINYYDEKIHAYLYQYAYPAEITSGLGKKYYWDLMNDVKSKPYIQKFEVSKYYKMDY